MRTILITGASSGIGAAAAAQLAGQGDRLVLVGRSPERTRATADRLGVEHHLVDYTRLESVRTLAATLNDRYERIDVLANNAGGLFPGPVRTVDGVERTFQVNYLAPFLLTHLLIEKLIESAASVVSTSSIASWMVGRLDINDLSGWREFRRIQAYGNSKLAVNIFTQQLHEHFHERGLSTVSFHPGLVATNLVQESDPVSNPILAKVVTPFLTPVEVAGGRLAHFVQGAPGLQWESGRYYGSNLKPGRINKQASNHRLAERTWELSSQMLAIRW